MVRLLGVDLPSTETTHPDLCSLHAPSQDSANRSASEGVLGAMVRPASVSLLVLTPLLNSPPPLYSLQHWGTRGKFGKVQFHPLSYFCRRALQVAPERPSTCLISPGHVAGHVGRKKGGLHNPDLAWPPRKLYGHGQRFRASLRPAPVISPKKVADRSYGPCNEHSQCVSAPRSRARTRLRQRRPRGIIYNNLDNVVRYRLRGSGGSVPPAPRHTAHARHSRRPHSAFNL